MKKLKTKKGLSIVKLSTVINQINNAGQESQAEKIIKKKGR